MAVKVKPAQKKRPRSAEISQQRKQTAMRAISVSAKSQELQEQLADLRKKLGISQKALAQLSSSSLRAVARWEAGEKPGEMALRMLNEVRRLYNGLSRVMKKDHIVNWLSIPNPAFDGLKPLEVIDRGEGDRIWRMIYDLEAGEPS